MCRLFIYGHGNVVRTIDTDFGLSAYQWRGVWGERQTGTLKTGKGYCANLGHQEDETGLIYMRARYYEPTTGRFISEDPARDGVNWYLYADGNAVGRVDFTGKNPDFSLPGLSVGSGIRTTLQGMGFELRLLLKREAENYLVVEVEMFQATGGHLGIRSFLSLARAWARGEGIQAIQVKMVGASVEGVKWAESLALVKMIERMGDKGLLQSNGPVSWLYWFLQ